MNRNRIFKFTIISLAFMLTLINSFSETVNAEDNLPKIMVSLGDSYSSGEGVEPFYGQYKTSDEKIKDLDWLSHRSENSWPGKLVLDGHAMSKEKDSLWYFGAVSGATTENLDSKCINANKQTKKYYLEKGKYNNEANPVILDYQYDIFDKLKENSKKADYVTMTIGGNDVGFADIVTSAVLSGNIINKNSVSDKLNGLWSNFFAENSTFDKLIKSYEVLIEKAGVQAEIIIAGYPQLFDEKNAHYYILTKDELALINSNVSKFNNAIKDIVKSYEKAEYNLYFVSVEEEFQGHGAYSNDPYINPIELRFNNSNNDDISQKITDITSAYSMHPNSKGIEAYAKCVQNKINEIESRKNNEFNTNDLDSNPIASEIEIASDSLHYKGNVFNPKDVVLKLFDSMNKGKYKDAVECLDPTSEKILNFVGTLASELNSLLTGEYKTWGQLALENAGAQDISLIECETIKISLNNNDDLISNTLSKIPLVNNLYCTDATIRVKYRYLYSNNYHIIEEEYDVHRYSGYGWRIINFKTNTIE